MDHYEEDAGFSDASAKLLAGEPVSTETTVTEVETPVSQEAATKQTPVAETAPLNLEESVDETPKRKIIVLRDPPTTIQQDFEALSINAPDVELKIGEHIAVLDAPVADAAERFTDNPAAEARDTPEARRWYDLVEQSYLFTTRYGQYAAAFDRPKAAWRQYVDSPAKGKLSYSLPKIGEDTAMVSGPQAVLRFRNFMGQGSLVSIPLWHSGFWITVRTPSDSVLIELKRRLVEAKITLGRQTHGLVFGNEATYSYGDILDVVLEHLYSTTLEGADAMTLREQILTNDLPAIFWGLACAIWPKGFQYSRALLTQEGIEEKQIVTGLINVTKLLWVDNAALTDWQKKHMSERVPNKMTKEQIARYRSEFTISFSKKVEIDDGNGHAFKATLTVPSAAMFIRTGTRWVDQLTQIVQEVYTSDRDDTARRNQAMVEHANATIIRNVSHWVEALEESEDRPPITDRDTIDEILDGLSQIDTVRDMLQKKVQAFMDETAISVIAIPEGTGKATGLPRFPHLIPLDVVSVFFILLMQRTARYKSNT